MNLLKGFTRVRNASLQLDSEETVVVEPLRAFSPNRISRHRRLQLSQRGNLYDESRCMLYFIFILFKSLSV